MLPWVKLGETTMPGGGVMTLMQCGSEFSIMSGVITLMNNRQNHSEEQLARLLADRVGARPKARILIGGLGMGFTLRAALQCFAADSEIVVSELVPEVVAWARGPLAVLHGTSLNDPRVRIHLGDVATAIGGGKPFDAILLDVDNGPDGLFRPANDRLYNAAGLAAAKSALTTGGPPGRLVVLPRCQIRQALEANRNGARGSNRSRPQQRQGRPSHHLDCREDQREKCRAGVIWRGK